MGLRGCELVIAVRLLSVRLDEITSCRRGSDEHEQREHGTDERDAEGNAG